jgi:hypothetical protein
MKKYLKITLYIVFYLFIILTIFAFLFIHTPYSKKKLKDYISQRVERQTGLQLEISSVSGNLVNNITFKKLSLQDRKRNKLLAVEEAQIGFNLFSIFSDSPEVNSLYLEGAGIDSLPKMEKLGRNRGLRLSIPEVYVNDLEYTHGNNNFHSEAVYGRINFSETENRIAIDTARIDIRNINERIFVSRVELILRNDTARIKNAKFHNRNAKFGLAGFYNMKSKQGEFDLSGKNILLQERLPKFSKLLDQQDYLSFASVTKIHNDSISAAIKYNGAIRGREISRGEASINITNNELSIPNVEFRTAEERYTGTLEGRLGDGFTAKLRIENLDLKKWEFIGNQTALSGDIILRQSGPGEQLGIKVNLEDGSIQDVNFDRIAGTLTLMNDKFRIDDTLAVDVAGNKMGLTGNYDIPSKNLNINGVVKTSDLDFFAPLIKADKLSGRINGKFRIAGHLNSPDIDCQLVGQDVAYRNIFFSQASLDLGISDLTGDIKGQLYVQGSHGRIEKFDPAIEHMEGRFLLQGDTTRVSFLSARGQDFEVNSEGSIYDYQYFQINNLDMKIKNTDIQNEAPFYITLKKDTLDISEVKLAFDQNELLFSGSIVNGTPKNMLISIQDVSLAPLHTLNKNIPQKGQLKGKVEYVNREYPEINVDLKAQNLLYKNMSFPRAEIISTIKKDSLNIENINVFIEENSSLNLEGLLSCNFPLKDNEQFLDEAEKIDVDVNCDNFPAEYINNFVLTGHNLKGQLTGNFTLHNNISEPVINTILRIDKPEFNRLNGEWLRARGFYRNDSLVLEEFELNEGNGNYTGQGYIPVSLDFFNRKFQMLPGVEMDMSFSAMTQTLPFISAPPNNNVEKITGDFFISLNISGTKDNIQKDGYYIADHANVNLTPLESSIRVIRSQGTMRNNILHIDNFEGKMVKAEAPEISEAKNRLNRVANYILSQDRKIEEKKNLNIKGSIDLEQFIRPGYDLEMSGQNLYFRTLLAETEGYVNGDLKVKGKDTVDVTGELEVSKVFMRKSFTQKERERIRNPRGPYSTFNIRTIIPSNFYISNDQMDCELSGDIWLIREGREPWRFSGDLSILEGSFYYFGWEFTNLSGNIYFDPVKMNPRLDIHSELNLTSFTDGDTREIGDDEEIVDVYLTGDMEKPDLQFSSDNYSQNDILSLIQGTSSAEGEQSSSIPGSALNVFGQYFERQLERRFSQISGIDRISFRTKESILQNRNLDNWKLTLGQRITPNIFITYEHGAVYNKPTQRVEVEYRFDRNHSLEGNVDQDGLFGINYKIRFNY